MKEIVLTPYGGLANRMRTLNAAIEFAKAEGARLQAVWFCNRELNAPYDELFTPPIMSWLQLKQVVFSTALCIVRHVGTPCGCHAL
jgi:hypothetical protein